MGIMLLMTLFVLLHSFSKFAFIYLNPQSKVVFVGYVIYTNPVSLKDKEVIAGENCSTYVSYMVLHT